MNGKNIDDELGEKGSEPQRPHGPDLESSDDDRKTNVSSKTPFKVRSRTSGIYFSYSHCQLLHLPPINLPNVERKCSQAELRLNSSSNFSKSQFQKLSTPIVVGQKSSEHKKLMTSMPLINPHGERQKYLESW